MTRRIAALLAGLTCALGAVTGAQAQDWPTKPVTIIVGFTAGGTTDIVARLLKDELQKGFGQPFVVENRPGAGGNIGAALVAKSAPDGYTLLMGSVGPLAVNASLYKKMPYDNLKDLAPISLVCMVPNMLVVNPRTVKATTFQEFVAEAKANPDKFFYASTGSGTSAHLSGVLLNQLAGLKMTHVPYKGSGWIPDVLAGDSVQLSFATIPSAINHVKSGRLRVLAVNSTKRSAGLPDVPTIAESGFPGFDLSSWFGMVGPAGLPRDIAAKVQREIARALAIPEMREKFIQQGADPVGNTPEEFGEFMRAETAKWAKLVKESGAKAD
jgi:tripartite-type tricarboxylate transporter receptor subunit TctC